MARFLTAADVSISLIVAGLFSNPQTLQGFEVDDIFSTPDVETAETKMGVDGKLSAGWIPAPIMMDIHLQGDSLSVDLFESVYEYEQAARTKLAWSGRVRIPALGKSYVMTNGYLKAYKPSSDAKKILQGRKFGLVWESVLPVPVA